MSAALAAAANVGAPIEDDIRVLALTTSASAEQNLGEFMGGDTTTDAEDNMRPVWVTFICDAAFYITFGRTAVTDPDGTATTGGGRTWLVPANTEWHRKITKRSRRFKARGVAAGTLRWTPSDAPAA